jgi:hypothetical protein
MAVEPGKNHGLSMARSDIADRPIGVARALLQEGRLWASSAITFAASARVAMHVQVPASARQYLAQAMRVRPQASWALPDRGREGPTRLGAPVGSKKHALSST